MIDRTKRTFNVVSKREAAAIHGMGLVALLSALVSGGCVAAMIYVNPEFGGPFVAILAVCVFGAGTAWDMFKGR